MLGMPSINYLYLTSFGMILVRAVEEAPVSTVVSKLMCTEMEGVVCHKEFQIHTTTAGVILQRNSRSRAPPVLLAMLPTAALAKCNSLEEIENH